MNYTRLLKLTRPYMNGPDVLAVQTKLAGLDFYNGAFDGIYGPMTKAAVIAYQKSTKKTSKLKVDGIVGRITWGALLGIKVSADRITFTEIANEQVENGSIYVLGSQGQTGAQITEAWITMREHGKASEIKRVLKLLAARLKAGFVNLRAFDCSGLVLWCLAQMGIKLDDTTANGIYHSMCTPITRQNLITGDLVFKKVGGKIVHVGIYNGDGTTTECKGRDDGVVRRSLNATGWNVYGSLKCIK